MATNVIKLERLKELFSYDPDTGHFTRLKNVANQKAGSIAGFKMSIGYIAIVIDRQQFYVHRLAWFYMTGVWPPEIDHENRNRSDNKWLNLRHATHAQNNWNKPANKKRSGLPKGVKATKKTNRYYSEIMVNRKSHYLGIFDTVEEAEHVYQIAAIKLRGEQWLPM